MKPSPLFAGKSHVIWDWNGTLFDDVDMCVEILNELLEKYNLARITKSTYRGIFSFPVRRYYERLGFDFDRLSFESIADEFIARYVERVRECELYCGAGDVLRALSAHGMKQSILSAYHESYLKDVVSRCGIFPYFEHLCGLSDNFAGGKSGRGSELIAVLGCDLKSLVMIGDTDHDVEVAGALGIDVVLLAHGHQDGERLKRVQGAVVLDGIGDLVDP